MIEMKLHWLKLDRPCILEIPQLKDFAGQPLVFRTPAFVMRCVTDDVFNNPLVQAYKDQLLLVEVDGNGAAFVPSAAPSVVVPEEPSVLVVKTPEAVTPTPEPEPEAPVAPEVEEVKVDEPASASVSTEEPSSKDGDADKGFEVKRRRNR